MDLVVEVMPCTGTRQRKKEKKLLRADVTSWRKRRWRCFWGRTLFLSRQDAAVARRKMMKINASRISPRRAPFRRPRPPDPPRLGAPPHPTPPPAGRSRTRPPEDCTPRPGRPWRRCGRPHRRRRAPPSPCFAGCERGSGWSSGRDWWRRASWSTKHVIEERDDDA